MFILAIDSTRECTKEEYNHKAGKLYPHNEVVEMNLILYLKENTTLLVTDTEDFEENGTLSKT